VAVTRLGKKEHGSLVKLNENGAPVEFYVAKHDYESELNGPGRTLLVRKDCHSQIQWGIVSSYPENSVYGNSIISKWLNGNYLAMLDENIQAALGATKFYHLPRANVSYVLSRSVFLLSATELGIEKTGLMYDGTELPVADILKIAELNGSAVAQWTRTSSIGNDHILVANGGGQSAGADGMSEQGCRPVFTLPASFVVDDDGMVREQAAPTISPAEHFLGVKSEQFNFSYTVNDLDGDTMTVTEKLDGAAKKVWTDVASGTELAIEWLENANEFRKILNGEHTITVEVSDGYAHATARFSFVKAAHRASITLAEPLAIAGDITVAVLAVVGNIPEDAIYQVEATNNGKDPSPVWQDVTAEVQSGENIAFENHVAANGAAFNFRVTVERGASNTGGYISAVTGAFQ